MQKPSAIEREAIVLQVVVETIEALVNHEMLNFSAGHESIQVTFKSPSQRAMFNVLLADMLEPVDTGLLGVEGSLIDALLAVATNPQLGAGDEAFSLLAAAKDWSHWLEQDIEVEVWFPSIDTQTRLKLKRHDFISICGNISKHNVSRLTGKATELSRLFENNGIVVGQIDALRALDDFHVRFHEDILVYHGTTIAELLNNLRWAIHEYLLPEFKRSYSPPPSEEHPMYSFSYPDGLVNAYSRARYWDLMNSVRERPWIPRFTGTANLKGDY